MAALKTAISICSILNLDFFRMLYEPFCLDPNFNIIEILSLNYIVALYPFLLIFLTYVLVTLYDREYRLLIWMWRPFKICSRKWLNDCNIRDSLIGVFATFLLLSYVKILATSIAILLFTLGSTPVYSYNTDGSTKYIQHATLYDASVQYFGTKHLPFVLLALVFTLVFTVLPFLLLLVYPCGCFHRLCLNRCGPGEVQDSTCLHGRLPRQLQDTATRHEVLCCLLLVPTSTDTVEPLLTDILYNGHLPATDNSNCTNSLCHSHNTKEASLQRTPLCSGERTLFAAPNSNLTSELRTKWAGPVLNQQD